MTHAKKLLAILIAMLVPFAVVANANADGETVEADTTLSPKSGSFYKEANVSSNLAVSAVVTPNPNSAVVNPTKNIKLTFPTGTTFKPNNKVCPDSKIGPSTNLSLGPKYMVDQCSNAVIGTGTAVIYLGKFKAAPLGDPVLIAFNAGRNNNGQPKMKVYGYSKQTTVGILINGTLKGRVLYLTIPVLSSDSAVGEFKLQIPGPTLNRPDLDLNVKGLDPNYVQARCASSPLVTNAAFEMGQRDVSTGQPTSPTVTVTAPQTTQPCTGLAGTAKLGGMKVKGPSAVKNGKKGAFKVTVKNTGTATAKNVVVTSNRGGKGKAGNIAPGASKTVTVKATIRGKKNRKVAVKFTAKSGNVKSGITKKVKVK